MDSIATRLQSCNQSVLSSPLLREFYSRLEYRPYCTAMPGPGMERMPREQAILLPYVGFNTASFIGSIDFDLDETGLEGRLLDVLGAPPTFMVENRPGTPRAGRGHAIYMLRNPIRGEHAGLRGFVGDVRRRLATAVGADVAFSDRLLKNPANSTWYVRESDTLVDLSELAERAPSTPRLRGRRLTLLQAGANTVGNRNNFLFHTLRFHAYDAIRMRLRDAHGQLDRDALLRELVELGTRTAVACDDPLDDSEVYGVIDSVHRWCCAYYRPGARAPSRLRFPPMPSVMDADARTAEVERRKRAGAAYTAKLKRTMREQHIRAAQARIAGRGERVTMAAVARELGLARSTIQRHADLFRE